MLPRNGFTKWPFGANQLLKSGIPLPDLLSYLFG